MLYVCKNVMSQDITNIRELCKYESKVLHLVMHRKWGCGRGGAEDKLLWKVMLLLFYVF